LSILTAKSFLIKISKNP